MSLEHNSNKIAVVLTIEKEKGCLFHNKQGHLQPYGVLFFFNKSKAW